MWLKNGKVVLRDGKAMLSDACCCDPCASLDDWDNDTRYFITYNYSLSYRLVMWSGAETSQTVNISGTIGFDIDSNGAIANVIGSGTATGSGDVCGEINNSYVANDVGVTQHANNRITASARVNSCLAGAGAITCLSVEQNVNSILTVLYGYLPSATITESIIYETCFNQSQGRGAGYCANIGEDVYHTEYVDMAYRATISRVNL